MAAPDYLHAGEVTTTSIEFSWVNPFDAPTEYSIFVNGMMNTRIPGSFTDYTLSGLTPNTGYDIQLCDSNGSQECAPDLYETTLSIPLRPVINLTTVVPAPTPTRTRTTWHPPYPDDDTTFKRYILYIKGERVNETIYLNDITEDTYIFDGWLNGCQTVTVDVVVEYNEGLSDKMHSSAHLGQRYPGTISPLVKPFSENDLKGKMLSAHEPYELNKLSDVNFHDGYTYKGLNRAYLPAFRGRAIEKLSDVEGYPQMSPVVMPAFIDIGKESYNVGQLYTVSSRVRWKIKTTNITPGFFSNPGTSGPEQADNIYSSGVSGGFTHVTENTTTAVRKGKIEFLYESGPCSGLFNMHMSVLGEGDIPISNNYITITQAGKNPPPDPDDGRPAAGSIESIHWVGTEYNGRPMPFPALSVSHGNIVTTKTVAQYNTANYTGTINAIDIKYISSGTRPALENQHSLVTTGRLAVDTTGGYSNIYQNGIKYKSTSGASGPTVFFGQESLPSSDTGDKIWYYDETIIKGIIDDNRLHFLTYQLPSGAASSIYVPVLVNDPVQVMLFEAVFKNTARVYAQTVKYLKLNLSGEHHGKAGISSKQRKVLSYDSTPVYLTSFTTDLRSNPTVVSSWHISTYIRPAGQSDVRMVFPELIFTKW